MAATLRPCAPHVLYSVDEMGCLNGAEFWVVEEPWMLEPIKGSLDDEGSNGGALRSQWLFPFLTAHNETTPILKAYIQTTVQPETKEYRVPATFLALV